MLIGVANVVESFS